MDNYRAWFRAKTETFKANYCNTVDDYFDLVLRQIEAFTSRTGDESPQELSRMIRHLEDTNTLYQQQLNWPSGRYFDNKPTFDVISSAINDATSVTNPITRDSYHVNDFAEYSTNQPQQANISQGSDANLGIPKYSDSGFFGRTSVLKRHQLTHNLERPFACNKCGRVFTRKGHLTVHLRKHSGTMKARCTWPGCTYQATNSSDVVKHIRQVHFKLPHSKTEQVRLGIVDERDARDYLEKM